MLELKMHRVLDLPGRAPAGMAWDGRSIWLNDYESGMLYQLDIESGQATKSILSAGVISGLTWDGHSLWQTRLDENWLQRINPAEHDIDQTLTISNYNRLSDLTWDGEQLWVLSQETGHLLKVDGENGRIISTFSVPVASTAITYLDGSFWITFPDPMRFQAETDSFDWIGEERHFFLAQIDSMSGVELERIELSFLPMGAEWANQRIWLAHPAAGNLYEYELA
ncbi:MAG: hypothetical protein PVH03_05865 [Chloroflexota bacterium]|jgi:hypothetical protein